MSSLNNLGDISSLMTNSSSNSSINSIPLNKIKPDPDQPRKNFDKEELQELANSIKQNDLLQPINIREDENGEGYIINCGERRYQACLLLEKEEILAVINNDFQKIGQLIENVIRVDLGLLEKAYFVADLLDQGFTQKQIAEQLGHKNTTWVSRHITVSKAPQFIIDAINAGQIDNLEVAQTLTSKSKKDSRWKKLIKEFLQELSDDDKVTTTMLRQFVSEATKFLEDQDSDSSKKDGGDEKEGEDKSFSFEEKFKKLINIESIMMPTLNRVATNEGVINAIEQMTPQVKKAFFALLLELDDDFTTEDWQENWEKLSANLYDQ